MYLQGQKEKRKEKNGGRLDKENKKSQESDSSTYPARPRNRNSTLSRKNDSRIIILEERAKALTLFWKTIINPSKRQAV